MTSRTIGLLLGLLLLASTAEAANLYVDNACTFNGTGLVDSCAASGGAAGRYNNLQSAMTAAVADDVIIVAVGSADYVTSNGFGYGNDEGFNFANSGTSGHPITLRNKAGERPVIRQCTSGSTAYGASSACDRTTISATERAFIVITSANCPANGPVGEMGLHVYGLIQFFSAASTAATLKDGNSVTCTEMEGGYSNTGDGNWSALWVEGSKNFIGRWNNIHDVTVIGPTGEGQQSSRAGIKLYETINSTFADNTITNVVEEVGGEGFTNFGVAIDCKASCVGNTFERNNIRNANVCFRWENQELAGSDWAANGMTGVVARNNVCVGDSAHNRPAFRHADGKITDYQVYNNTVIGFNTGLGEDDHPSSNVCGTITDYNNAFVPASGTNLEMGDGSGVSCTFTLANYNVYTTGFGFKYNNTTHSTLALWKASNSNLWDQASSTLANLAAFQFTNTGTGDYTLGGSSPLLNAGKTGGTSGGSTINVGAYTAAVTCVGHLCGAAGAPAPTVSSASPNSGTTAGGTAITITGSDFVSTPTSITVGGVACTGIGFTNSTTITCTTGAHSAGAVDIIVTNPDAQAGTGTGIYTYSAPGATGGRSPTTFIFRRE